MTLPLQTFSPPANRESTAPLPYRPDIDGMRAVAVTMVLLFHAFPNFCPSGFMGVDMFFVLSGYLISGIVLSALGRDEFSFTAFYARRIRRIFPALILVLTATLAVGWYVLAPTEWRTFSSEALYGAGFVTNLMQPKQVNYFDNRLFAKPLLHLWSLGIEEQFYLFWPVTLFQLYKLTKRRWWMFAAILLLASISFATDIWILPQRPAWTFYSPVTRMWELLAGGAVAQIAVSSHARSLRWMAELFSITGAVLIATGIALLDPERPFPGWWTLLPVLGTACLIAAGSQAWLNRFVLASKLFVAVGLISYPLYLWHWPILVFFRMILQGGFDLTEMSITETRWAALALALVLAWGTYRLIERPLRFSSVWSSVLRVRLSIAGLAAVAALAWLGSNKVEPRLHSSAVEELERAASDRGDAGNSTESSLRTFDFPSGSQKYALLVGDSHMEQYINRARVAVQSNPALANAVFATFASCPPEPGMLQNYHGRSCGGFQRYWKALAKETRFSIVAFSAYWESYGSPTGDAAATREYEQAWENFAIDLRTLVEGGKRVVIISSNPTSFTFDPSMGFGRLPFPRFFRLKPVSRFHLDDTLVEVDRRLGKVARESGAEILSPRDYLCNRENCPAIDKDGIPMYRDDNHLRPSRVAQVATYFDSVLRP